MARLFFLVVIFAILATLGAAKPRGFKRDTNSTFPLGTRTSSAVQARQLTRDRFIARSEKVTMQNLFGRVDCAVPEPSTGVCDCGPDWHLCNAGTICRDFENDPLHCNSCSGVCSGTNPACCSGACKDLDSNVLFCGSCTHACDGGEECCGGSCADTLVNPENCGTCGNVCDAVGGEGCCNGACLDLQNDVDNCGTCGNSCGGGETCCSGDCVNLAIDVLNCGICGNTCDIIGLETCIGSLCLTP